MRRPVRVSPVAVGGMPAGDRSASATDAEDMSPARGSGRGTWRWHRPVGGRAATRQWSGSVARALQKNYRN